MLKLDNMDRERLDTTKKIIDVQSRIDMAAQEEHGIDKINSDLENHIRGLQNERINLLKDLEKLTVSNDEFVREVGVQRRNVDHQNDW
jgi:predicted small metal-binding protein